MYEVDFSLHHLGCFLAVSWPERRRKVRFIHRILPCEIHVSKLGKIVDKMNCKILDLHRIIVFANQMSQTGLEAEAVRLNNLTHAMSLKL